jgi:hypothetical protein
MSVAFGVSDAEMSDWLQASDVRRRWMSIRFSEFEGAEFDLRAMEFKQPAR